MKLKIGDKVYLQKYDIAFIADELHDVPGLILHETFTYEEDDFFYIDAIADGLIFGYTYQEPANIKWLMEQDWIIDYDEYTKMPLTELEALYENLIARRSVSINNFDAGDSTYSQILRYMESEEFSKLGHKINSLELLIKFRKGQIHLYFPRECCSKITAPDTPAIPDVTSKPTEKLGFFARLLSHSAR